MDDESAAGEPILRHVFEAPPTPSSGDPAVLDAVTAHVERHVGPVASVWHQRQSPWVHVDVLVMRPTAERPFFTFVTAGMSERAMAAPDPALARAELVLALPRDWPLAEDRGLWPLTLLQTLAELPHRFDTWLWAGHTVPNGDPPAPYAPGTRLCGAILAAPLLVPDAFDVLDGVHFHSVLPLHADELELKLRRGADELFARLERAGVSELLDPDRPSVGGGLRRSRFRSRRG
ncbi:MAG TPA: suppressor of fused domain protein [Solirubrobacter sp.]|nr:suppressor of fused domain protein [Solirubrobacter sp.]